jgi:hypothetical protein
LLFGGFRIPFAGSHHRHESAPETDGLCSVGRPAHDGYSLPAAAFFMASSNFLMSSGDSLDRSIARVIFLIAPVNLNGGL